MLGLLLLVGFNGWGQEDVLETRKEFFNSRQDLNKYIFQNSELDKITKGFFLDYIPEFEPEAKKLFFERIQNEKLNREVVLSFLQTIEASDISRNFRMDTLLFPVMNEFFSNNGTNKLRIPIIIGDIDFSYVNDETYNEIFLKHRGDNPFPALRKEQIENKNISFVHLFADTLINNDINIYWNDKTYLRNTDKSIQEVQIIIDGNTYSISKNENFALSDYYSEKKPLTQIKYRIIFSNESQAVKSNNLYLAKYKDLIENHAFNSNSQKSNSYIWDVLESNQAVTINGDPNLNIRVLWGCDPNNEKKLDKPFIMVAGWGPFTDQPIINNAQGWPSSLIDFYWSINQNGYIDSLVGVGYDVILAKFYPPNVNVLKNVSALQHLITLVNEEKFSNGSYHENIVAGYSAGAMCVRLTLELMEWEHMQDPIYPHHHSKLFISFDGEHAGANIPLGIQHAVKYLKEYHAPFGPFPFFTIYALYSILHAPLSKELVRYFYTETGSSSYPGQGAHPSRAYYLQKFNQFNHSKNTHNPGYPGFTRNISISNGTSHRTNNSPVSSLHPYFSDDGENIFKHKVLRKRWEVNLLGKPSGVVFKYEEHPWFNWKIRMEGVTNNPLILDNTPGGTTFLAEPNKCADQNITYQVLKRMEVKTTLLPFGWGSADHVDYKAMYSFTPTFLTHDIRNINYQQVAGGRRLIYDMKAEGLMFQDTSEITDVEDASKFFGYPHLAHPTDHYTNYTPFDAVFAWDKENTVHIQSGETIWNEDGISGCQNLIGVLGEENPDHKRWEQHASPIITEVNRFILGEADTYHAYIQNRSYGWNAHPNAIYKADIVSKHKIFIGKNVTQRTNFKPVEIEENAEVRFIACEQVYFGDGFHAKSGSTFHAKIDDETCRYCSHQGMAPPPQPQLNVVKAQTNDETSNKLSDESELPNISIYPNPGVDKVTINTEGNDIREFHYVVNDLTGKEITSKSIIGNKTTLYLNKGVYIIRIKINESWYTRKLIMY